MNKILISALLLTAGYAFGQVKTDWDRDNLKQKVKSTKVTMFLTAKDNKNNIIKGEIISNFENRKTTYNSSGEGEEVIYYDANDNVTEVIRLPKNDILRERINTYRNPNKGFEDKYDDKGNIIETTYSDDNGNVLTKSYYKYNDKGYRIEHIYNSINVEPRYRRFVFEYDKKGNKVRDIAFNEKGEKIDQARYRYNRYNDMVKEKSDKTVMKYRYKYDDNKNWIEKITISENKPLMISERTIEYYN